MEEESQAASPSQWDKLYQAAFPCHPWALVVSSPWKAGRENHSIVAPTADGVRRDLTFRENSLAALAEEMEVQSNSNFNAGKL